MKINLSCEDCLKNLHCKILNEIEEIKTSGMQLKLSDNEDVRDILKELEVRKGKCLRRRIYLHNHIPKYILFRDSKYIYSDDKYHLYKYCNKEEEYLLNING